MPRPKPAATPAKPRQRDHAKENEGRATKHRVELALTEAESDDLARLRAALDGAPAKQSLLAAVRAALALLDGEGAPVARRLLKADLEPAKPGPKVTEE